MGGSHWHPDHPIEISCPDVSSLWLLGSKYPDVQLDWNVILHFLQVWAIGLATASVAYLGGALARNMLGLQ